MKIEGEKDFAPKVESNEDIIKSYINTVHDFALNELRRGATVGRVEELARERFGGAYSQIRIGTDVDVLTEGLKNAMKEFTNDHEDGK